MKKKDESANLAVSITQFIFGLILLVMILFSFISCGSLHEIPVQTIEKEIIRDSIIRIIDTVRVEVPYEKIVEVVPKDTTSQIATSLAFSEAKIEGGYLHHSLEQKGQIQAKIDTCYITQIKEKIVEKEVAIEVPVEVKHTPKWVWWSLIFNIVIILLIAFKIYLKTKGVSLK
jgi:hypothetical protein